MTNKLRNLYQQAITMRYPRNLISDLILVLHNLKIFLEINRTNLMIKQLNNNKKIKTYWQKSVTLTQSLLNVKLHSN